jgi:hypothetical protein
MFRFNFLGALFPPSDLMLLIWRDKSTRRDKFARRRGEEPLLGVTLIARPGGPLLHPPVTHLTYALPHVSTRS